jgi:hypothetical protein
MGLLCAAFPDDGTPELPNARSRQECTKRRGAPSSSTSSGPAHLADTVIISPERPQYEAAHDAPTPQQLGAQSQPGNQPQVFASVHIISPHGLGSKWPLKGDGDPWFGIGGDQMAYVDPDII